jgi:hypothetical protein
MELFGLLVSIDLGGTQFISKFRRPNLRDWASPGLHFGVYGAAFTQVGYERICRGQCSHRPRPVVRVVCPVTGLGWILWSRLCPESGSLTVGRPPGSDKASFSRLAAQWLKYESKKLCRLFSGISLSVFDIALLSFSSALLSGPVVVH